MKVIAVNGSPRKKWNTATLLEKALEGAASRGAETELVHLYDLNFKGCISCFACKTIDGPSYGRCAVKDGLAPLLEKIAQADAMVLGSPIYYGTVTGETRSFMERLFFPFQHLYRPARIHLPEEDLHGLYLHPGRHGRDGKGAGIPPPHRTQRDGAENRIRSIGIAHELRHLSVRGLLKGIRSAFRP